MTSSVLPDVNVWLALSSPDHERFPIAWSWYVAAPEKTVLTFCRLTQLGFLRLLTTQTVMGQGTLTPAQAWEAYDRWIEAAGAEFAEEPPDLESTFRGLSGSQQASPKEWADSYLTAFSSAAGLQLVTFDRALAGMAKRVVLLG